MDKGPSPANCGEWIKNSPWDLTHGQRIDPISPSNSSSQRAATRSLQSLQLIQPEGGYRVAGHPPRRLKLRIHRVGLRPTLFRSVEPPLPTGASAGGAPDGRLAGEGVRCYSSPSSSSSQRLATASLGIRQSPRGERATEPTLGPSGRQERLNCWEKKRR